MTAPDDSRKELFQTSKTGNQSIPAVIYAPCDGDVMDRSHTPGSDVIYALDPESQSIRSVTKLGTTENPGVCMTPLGDGSTFFALGIHGDWSGKIRFFNQSPRRTAAVSSVACLTDLSQMRCGEGSETVWSVLHVDSRDSFSSSLLIAALGNSEIRAWKCLVVESEREKKVVLDEDDLAFGCYGHANPVRRLLSLEDAGQPERMVSAANDRTLRVWDLSSARCIGVASCGGVLRTRRRGERRIAGMDAVAVAPNRNLALCCTGTVLELWDLRAMSLSNWEPNEYLQVSLRNRHPRTFGSMHWWGRHNMIVLGASGGVAFWDIRKLQTAVQEISFRYWNVNAFCLQPGGLQEEDVLYCVATDYFSGASSRTGRISKKSDKFDLTWGSGGGGVFTCCLYCDWTLDGSYHDFGLPERFAFLIEELLQKKRICCVDEVDLAGLMSLFAPRFAVSLK